MSLPQFEKKTVGVVLIFCSSDFHGSCSFFLEFRSHWNPIQCGVYRAIVILQIAAIFWHKGSYLARQKIIIKVTAFFSIDIYQLISKIEINRSLISITIDCYRLSVYRLITPGSSLYVK